jgi:SAM-dependent MidA family methyltransferase
VLLIIHEIKFANYFTECLSQGKTGYYAGCEDCVDVEKEAK